MASAHGVACGLRVAVALVVFSGRFSTAVTFATILLLFTIASSASLILVVTSLVEAIASGARAITTTLAHFTAPARLAVGVDMRLLFRIVFRELWQGHGN